MAKMNENAGEQELKGKALKAAQAKKAKKEPKQKEAKPGILNFGKCVTCSHFPHKLRGEAQRCKVLGAYVPRKAEHPECYKCKFGG